MRPFPPCRICRPTGLKDITMLDYSIKPQTRKDASFSQPTCGYSARPLGCERCAQQAVTRLWQCTHTCIRGQPEDTTHHDGELQNTAVLCQNSRQQRQ